jgi:hypothetical protein
MPAALAALSMFALASADDSQKNVRAQAKKSPPTPAPITIKAGELADNPDRYYGQVVRVTAEVEDVLGRQAFVLDEDRAFAFPDVLVITPAVTALLPEGTVVTVTGTVKAFLDAELRRDHAWNWWTDLDTDVPASFNGSPVLVAGSIIDKDGRELVKQQ